jgi:hypothetical protein
MGPEPKKQRRRSPRQGPSKPLAVRNAKGQRRWSSRMRCAAKSKTSSPPTFSTIEIAAELDMSTASLEKHLRKELVGGRNRVHFAIANNILQGTRDGDRTLPIYASKSQCTSIQQFILARFWTSTSLGALTD